MVLTFLSDTEIEICTNYNEETDAGEFENEVFTAGESIQVYLLDEGENHIDIQFCDGSVCIGLPKYLVKVGD